MYICPLNFCCLQCSHIYIPPNIRFNKKVTTHIYQLLCLLILTLCKCYTYLITNALWFILSLYFHSGKRLNTSLLQSFYCGNLTLFTDTTPQLLQEVVKGQLEMPKDTDWGWGQLRMKRRLTDVYRLLMYVKDQQKRLSTAKDDRGCCSMADDERR